MRDKTDDTRVNRDITALQVRLLDVEGEQVGVVSTRDALFQARDAGLDLVEISPNAVPPVCRIMDYGKFLFQKSKQKAVAKKNQKQSQIKEIKLRPATEEADYQVKLKKLISFLEEGDKAKITVRFRGREMTHQELGMEMLMRLEKDLEPYGIIEQRPKLEGRQMMMMLGPRKK